MPALIIHHRVADFDTWKPQFDDHESTRQRYGLLSHELYRLKDDPNDVVIVLKCESLERARTLAESPELEDIMRRAGVIGAPTYFYLDDVEAARYVAKPKTSRPEASPS